MLDAYATSLRIALIIHSLKGGGAERLMSQLASRWAAAGHVVHLITLSAVETDAHACDQRVIRHGLDLMADSQNFLRGVVANLQRVRRLRNQLRQLRPEFILSFCDRMNIVAASATAGLHVPTWLAEHSDPRKQRLGSLWHGWRKLAYPRATGCIVLTQPIAQWMLHQFPRLRIEVIPPAIAPPSSAHTEAIGDQALNDLSARSTREGRDLTDGTNHDQSRYRLLMLGRHSPEKNVIGLLGAWKLIAEEFPDWDLVIAGDGPQHAELIQANHELGLDSRVEFTGWIFDPWSLIRSSDALVLPSHYEGFPVSLLEAMSQGLPCVSSPAGDSILELARSGSLELAASAAPADLAAALHKVLSSSRRRDELSAAGKALAALYDWSVIGPLWDRLLTDAVARRT